MKYYLSIRKRFQSFSYAFNGLRVLFKEEHNARIHLLAAVLLIALSLFTGLNSSEWAILVLCTGFVLAMEAMNTCLENLCNFISPEKHAMIKRIKDISAAAVFLSALAALIVGLLIFIPKLQTYF